MGTSWVNPAVKDALLLPEEEQGGTGLAGEERDRPFTFILSQRLAMLQGSKDCAHLPIFPPGKHSSWRLLRRSGDIRGLWGSRWVHPETLRARQRRLMLCAAFCRVCFPPRLPTPAPRAPKNTGVQVHLCTHMRHQLYP